MLITAPEIKNRVQEIADEISETHHGEELLLLGVLNGAVVFMSDLVRALRISVTFDFISITRYQRRSQGSGEVQITKDVEAQLGGRNVILVEDIVDTGLTLSYLLRTLNSRHPASLQVCTLLDRPGMRLVPLSIQYVGFTIPKDFVVGYGLDFQGRHRHLPYICLLTPPPPRSRSESRRDGRNEAAFSIPSNEQP